MHRSTSVAAAAAVRAAAVAATLAAAPSAAAQTAAMVVAVEAGAPPVAELEQLPAGRTVRLGPGDRIVLGYVASCVVETVSGPGSVRVGAASGSPEGGALVRRRTVDCVGRPQAGTTAGEGGAFRSRSVRAPSVEERARAMLAALRAGAPPLPAATPRAAEPPRAAPPDEQARPPWWRRLFGGGDGAGR
jgi:hypothetical protein